MNRLLLGLGVLAAIGSVGIARSWPSEAPASTASARPSRSTSQGGTLEPWGPGITSLSYSSETSSPRAADEAKNGHVRLEVDATFEPCGEQILAVTITRVHKLEVSVAGGELGRLADPTGERVYLAIEKGRVQRMSFRREAAPLTKQLLEGMLRRLQLTLPSGEPATAWESSEPGLHGAGAVRYTRSGATIERARDRYEDLTLVPRAGASRTSVRGTTRFELVAERIQSLREEETVTVGAPAGGVELVSTSTFQYQMLAPAQGSSENECTTPTDDLEVRSAQHLHSEPPGPKMIEAAAEGRTLADITRMVGDFERSGRAPSSAEIVQSVALLVTHPEHATPIARLAIDKANGRHGRQLAMDVLASAGHDAARAAMRSVFEPGGITFDDAAFGLLVQRFSFVERPELVDLELLERLRSKAPRSAHHATTYALGSTIGHLARTDLPSAERFAARLVDDLGRAHRSDEKIPLLAALGNAGLARDLELVASYARDKDPEVRAQAATALRRQTDPRALGPLLDLLGDDSPRVANHALDAIVEQRRPPAVIAARVAAGRTHPELDPKVVDLFAQQPDRDQGFRAALAVIRARTKDPRLIARLAKM